MGAQGVGYFVLAAIVGPLTLILNTVAAVGVFSVQEARRHSIVISLCVLHILFAAYNFLDQYYWNFLSVTHKADDLKFADDIIHSWSLPLYLSSALHMYVLLLNLTWSAYQRHKSLMLQQNHLKYFSVAVTLTWIVPGLTFLLYIKFEVKHVIFVSLKYPILIANILFIVLLVGTLYFICKMPHVNRRGLLEDEDVAAQELVKREDRILKMYIVITLNYVLLASLPLTVYGIIVHQTGSNDLNKSIESAFEGFLQLWPATNPIIFFVFYWVNLREIAKMRSYIPIAKSSRKDDDIVAMDNLASTIDDNNGSSFYQNQECV